MPERIPATILNVDDEEAGRYTTTRLLRQAGYTVVEAATGEEAVRQAAEQLPDLIILDVHLPDINGFEVRRRIRENPALALTPIMHLSATAADSRHIAEGLEEGADAYLAEPVEPRVLLATVKALVRMHQAERARRESQALAQALVEGLPDPVYVKDREGPHHYGQPGPGRRGGQAAPQKSSGGGPRSIFATRRPDM